MCWIYFKIALFGCFIILAGNNIIYIISDVLFMFLCGIFICTFINAKALSIKIFPPKKKKEYYYDLKIQIKTWVLIMFLIGINEVSMYKSNTFNNIILNLCKVFFQNNSYKFYVPFRAMADINILTFFIISVMGLTYISEKYLLYKSTSLYSA